MYMNNKSESDLLETFGSIVKGTGDWFGAAVPAAQTHVWWVAGAILSTAALLAVSARWDLRDFGDLVLRVLLRRNPTVSGMRHARR